MYLPEVYVGLGGNIGDSCAILKHAIEKIVALPHVYELQISRFYCTTPVSSIPQDPYINAVVHFKTTYSAHELLGELQKIEQLLGKKKKPKESPRVIDLDILFFGVEIHRENHLEIPHPRWSERLFVVTPLADLVTHLIIPDPQNLQALIIFDVKKYLQNFPNTYQETVAPLPVILRNPCKLYDSKNSILAKINP